MDEATPQPRRFSRFTKHVILGAVFGGVLSSIPVLSCINCLFCLLNMAGVVFALSLYLKANPEDTLTVGESVGFGAAAGAGAGLIASIASLLLNLMFGTMMAAMTESMPDVANNEFFKSMAVGGAMSILLVPVYIILFSVFGLLGAFLGMKLFFKTRLRQS
ncbi:MAG: hypothetical protein LBQ86_07130 [Holophagales bacterium]|jgi:hypothetical protein|nr:hypothetical protein [Holophagales bacterium]